MPKTAEQYLEQHDGDAAAALNAAVRDVAQRESQAKAARAFKRAYTPLVEALSLPADVDLDSEPEAQTLAARALEGLGKPSARETQALAALTRAATAYAKTTGVDLLAALKGLPENADDAAIDARLTEALAPVTALQDRARRADLQDAAAFAGKPVDALADYLEGKTWGKRTVRGEDGSEREEWGVGEGEAFRPLTELPAVRAIASASDKPAPVPLPTGQRGGNAPAPKTVEQRTAELRREILI